MTLAWPVTLPVYFQEDDFQETTPDNVLNSQPDVGPPKSRPRSTSAPTILTGSLVVTTSQSLIFDTFCVSTLASRSLPFSMTHPRTGVTVDTRIISPPVYTPYGISHWRVTCKFYFYPHT